MYVACSLAEMPRKCRKWSQDVDNHLCFVASLAYVRLHHPVSSMLTWDLCQAHGNGCPSGVHSELNLDSRPYTTAMVALESPHSSLPSLQHLGSATAAAGQKVKAAVPDISGSVPTREEPQAAA